jgi:hypothetical protein
MFDLLILAGLFVALTPGILFKLKGPKMVVATAHALLFGIVAYVVSVYFMSYDGFQSGPTPTCPGGGVFVTGTKQCSIPIICPDGFQQIVSENGTVSCSMSQTTSPKCPDSYSFNGKECTSTPTSCPAPYVLTNGDCIAPTQTTGGLGVLKAPVLKKMKPPPKKPANISYLTSTTDKNGNTISVGSVATCTGPKGTHHITVSQIESKPSSIVLRGTENGNSRAYKLSSCVAASGGESTSIFS